MAHKDLWEMKEIIDDQKTHLGLFAYEKFLLNSLSIDYLESYKIRIVGCGTGREVLPLLELFPNSHFYCEDISSGMIEKAKQTIGPNNRVCYETISVAEIANVKDLFDLTICFNSILNYLTPHENRLAAFENIYNKMKNNATVIGVVHTAYEDNIIKSLYFFVMLILKFYSHDKYEKVSYFNHKHLGRNVKNKVKIYYYTKNTLRKYLGDYKNVMITTIREYYKGDVENKSQSNYLLFSATKK